MAKHTPLYEAHLAAGARMIEFAGFDMPVQYQGLVEDRVPDAPGAVRGAEHFEPIFPGVPGARDQTAAHSGHRPFAEVVVGHVEHRSAAELLDQLGRAGALHRDLRPLVALLFELDALARVGAHPFEVLLASGRIDADEQAPRGEAVDDHVVDHPAALVADRGVLGLAVLAV